ncbi:hypothetical protein D3C85_1652940 [compost metagenome]
MDQRRGTRHVGEQRRDGLALAGGRAPGFHRRLLRQDAFDQVAWGVVDGSGRRRQLVFIGRADSG